MTDWLVIFALGAIALSGCLAVLLGGWADYKMQQLRIKQIERWKE